MGKSKAHSVGRLFYDLNKKNFRLMASAPGFLPMYPAPTLNHFGMKLHRLHNCISPCLIMTNHHVSRVCGQGQTDARTDPFPSLPAHPFQLPLLLWQLSALARTCGCRDAGMQLTLVRQKCISSDIYEVRRVRLAPCLALSRFIPYKLREDMCEILRSNSMINVSTYLVMSV